jgi:hypothetical protein
VSTVDQPRRRGRRGRRSSNRIEELSYRKPHPVAAQKADQLDKMFKSNVFAQVNAHSEQARIGEYVMLEISPQVLHIKIAKGVQNAALKILTTRVYEHVQSATTRLFLKKSTRTGKFSYKLWIGAQVLKDMSENDLFERILKVTNDRKRSVTIIVKQNIFQGSIQALWEQKHSLL